MPDLKAHEEAATRNQVVLDCMVANHDLAPDDFAPWVVTVAFYKALHLVEGIFYIDGLTSNEKRPIHSKDHAERNGLLKTVKNFQHLWRNYRPLWEASMVARYLFDPKTDMEQTDLSAYLSGDSIRSKFINHYLCQIEKSFSVKKTDYETNHHASR